LSAVWLSVRPKEELPLMLSRRQTIFLVLIEQIYLQKLNIKEMKKKIAVILLIVISVASLVFGVFQKIKADKLTDEIKVAENKIKDLTLENEKQLQAAKTYSEAAKSQSDAANKLK
jgi:hypothetical protein